MNFAMQIGQRIKSYRTGRQMTIKDLAAQAHITPSMLSQIERGQANPSLNTIRLLAQALEEPMFRFFMDEAELRPEIQNEVVHKETRRHMIVRGIDYELLSPDMNGDIELMTITMAPGTISAREPMSHEGEEVALVLKGTLEIVLENDVCVLNEGDSIRFKRGVKHCWNNTSNQDVVVVFAISPPCF